MGWKCSHFFFYFEGYPLITEEHYMDFPPGIASGEGSQWEEVRVGGEEQRDWEHNCHTHHRVDAAQREHHTGKMGTREQQWENGENAKISGEVEWVSSKFGKCRSN